MAQNETTHVEDTKPQYPYLQLYEQDRLSELQLGYSSLYSVALAFLAEVDIQRKASNIYSQEFLKGFSALRFGKSNVNFINLLEHFVAVCDSMWDKEFAHQTFRGQIRVDRKADEYNPAFDLHRTYEAHKTLGEVNIFLLVKALRLFVIELCRRVFGQKSDPAKWTSSKATYSLRSTKCSCANFIDFVNALLGLYNCVMQFSNELREVRTVLENCVTAQRASRVADSKSRTVTNAVRHTKPAEVRPMKIRVNTGLAIAPKKQTAEEPDVKLDAEEPVVKPATEPVAYNVSVSTNSADEPDAEPVEASDGWTEVKPQRIIIAKKRRDGKTRTITARLNK